MLRFFKRRKSKKSLSNNNSKDDAKSTKNKNKLVKILTIGIRGGDAWSKSATKIKMFSKNAKN